MTIFSPSDRDATLARVLVLLEADRRVERGDPTLADRLAPPLLTFVHASRDEGAPDRTAHDDMRRV